MAEKTLNKKRKKGVEQLKSRYGRLFVLPWEIGLVLFFIVPIITSLIYSFSDVVLGSGGITSSWAGLKWYEYIINKDPNYMTALKSAISNFAVQLPIIVALSLILAIILNQKFAGRMMARAIFFLPVIIATGVILDLLTSEYINVSLITSSAESSGAGNYGSSMIDFDAILGNLGLPEDITKIIGDYIGSIFNLLWSCGIQIVLFIAGLQTIPDQLYEVSKVEGASKWEEFWYITIPMLGNTILLVMVYTMIDIFTKKTGVMENAFTLMEDKLVYDQSSAMLWFYFLIVAAIMAVVLAIYNRLCLKRWN
ncbi:MAG: sugar ABC transporter permease [Acutalibacteraceae bacterium]|nr:sugar ABC transporter permease [Acutalibacteraceae bacterium]